MTWASDVEAMWANRAEAEAVAVERFRQLGEGLASVGQPLLSARAMAASEDEYRHAELCRALSGTFCGRADDGNVAPSHLPSARRTLYEAVAICCVAESINAALLQRTLVRATDPTTLRTTRALLVDEVQHAQLGWAILAETSDRTWLRDWIPVIKEATLTTKDRELLGAEATCAQRVAHGLLDPAERLALFDEAWATVIVPGFELLGVLPGST